MLVRLTSSWRTVCLVVGSVLGLVFLVLGLQVMVWLGTRDVPLRFVVVEAGTGTPVKGATVVVSEWPSQGKSYQARTGPDGTAELKANSWTAGRSGLFVQTAYVSFVGWRVHVSREGYADLRPVYLSTYTGEQLDFEQLPPPPVRLELRKVASSGE